MGQPSEPQREEGMYEKMRPEGEECSGQREQQIELEQQEHQQVWRHRGKEESTKDEVRGIRSGNRI